MAGTCWSSMISPLPCARSTWRPSWSGTLGATGRRQPCGAHEPARCTSLAGRVGGPLWLAGSARLPGIAAAGLSSSIPGGLPRPCCSAVGSWQAQSDRLPTVRLAPVPSLSLPASWVDDCHAAVVCCDPAAARQVLAAAAKAGDAAEYRLRGFADAGNGTRKLAASGALPGLSPVVQRGHCLFSYQTGSRPGQP